MTKPSLLAVVFAFAVALFLLLPLIAVVPVSFTPARFLSMPTNVWSLRHYQALLDDPAWLDSIWLSLRIGVLSSIIATLLALAFSLGIWMFRPWFGDLLFGFVLLPMVAPPVVSAITLYFFLTSLSKFNSIVAYDTWIGVAVAHAVMIAPFAVVLITVALSQVDRRIDLAARGFGASVGQRIFKVILPNIRFGILTAAFLSFVLSWEEIGVTLFITSVNAVTLPRMMWMGLRDNIDPAIAAISVVLIVIVVVVIFIKTLVTARLSRKIDRGANHFAAEFARSAQQSSNAREKNVISTGMYLTKMLQAYGVDRVFGIPGVHTVELYRGLQGSAIAHVTPRHEQGAGFMADGYARATGKPGVCFIITGPGMTNIATAMGQAYGDSVPMLVISTVNAHGRMGSGDGWLHELPDQQSLMRGVSAFSTTVNTPEELAPALARAFAVFDSARPRPVHIELPINVMLASAGHLPVPETVVRLSRPNGNPTSLAAAAELLAGARTPLILAGGGAMRAAANVRALAEALDAPVAMTTNGRGILPPEHPLGVHLSASMPATRHLVEASDVVLAIGTEFGPTDYDMYEDGFFTIPGKLIRIDIDPAQIMRTRPPEIGIVGDSDLCAAQLLALVPRSQGNGASRARAVAAMVSRDLSPAMVGDLGLLNRVRDVLPQALIVGDSTQLVYAGNSGFAAATPGSYFNSATGYGTLGYGLPAGIGAKVGCPGRPVVVLAGDGGVQFSIAELASAVEAKAPVILLLHDNKGYGEIKSYMISQNIPPLGVDLHTPDFVAIGLAYGWHAERVSTVSELENAIKTASDRQVPSMLVFGDDLRAEATAQSSM